MVFVDTPAFPDPGSSDSVVVAALDVEKKIQDWLEET